MSPIYPPDVVCSPAIFLGSFVPVGQECFMLERSHAEGRSAQQIVQIWASQQGGDALSASPPAGMRIST